MHYTKRPVDVEAMQFTPESAEEIVAWGQGQINYTRGSDPLSLNGTLISPGTPPRLLVNTPGGMLTATPGYWVVQCGGEFAVATPDGFAREYQPSESGKGKGK